MSFDEQDVALPPPLPARGQIVVEKVDYDISSNPNFESVLERFKPARFVVFGVATDYCVRASTLTL